MKLKTGRDEGEHQPPIWKRVWAGVSWLVRRAFWWSFAGWLVSLFASYHWAAELASHFRVQYAFITMSGAAVYATRGRHLFTLATSVLALVIVYPILPYWIPVATDRSEKAAQEPTIRVATFNLLAMSRDVEALRTFCAEERPDVLILEEVTPWWAEQIDALPGYADKRIAERNGAFGIAVLTRLPIDRVQLFSLGNAAYPAWNIVVNTPSGRVRVMGVHATPPVGARRAALRNQQLAKVAAMVRQDEPTVVLGDLNVTPWSPWFRDLLDDSGLRDARRGFGVLATWPAQIPPARMPIDHCLISRHFTVVDARRGPFAESDHAPLVVDLRRSTAPSASGRTDH
ncbi:MAG: endonuclease/exonuclease/phosphatase family protein [Pirellulaceae bacterium]|nr:endonuclease/exonuclease/phosphatase family protein [Pirellulaceae bacterium]